MGRLSQGVRLHAVDDWMEDGSVPSNVVVRLNATLTTDPAYLGLTANGIVQNGSKAFVREYPMTTVDNDTASFAIVEPARP